MSTREEMIAHERTVDEVAAELGCDSLAYLSLGRRLRGDPRRRATSTATPASPASTRWRGRGRRQVRARAAGRPRRQAWTSPTRRRRSQRAFLRQFGTRAEAAPGPCSRRSRPRAGPLAAQLGRLRAPAGRGCRVARAARAVRGRGRPGVDGLGAAGPRRAARGAGGGWPRLRRPAGADGGRASPSSTCRCHGRCSPEPVTDGARWGGQRPRLRGERAGRGVRRLRRQATRGWVVREDGRALATVSVLEHEGDAFVVFVATARCARARALPRR